jgi:hypothetical protein
MLGETAALSSGVRRERDASSAGGSAPPSTGACARGTRTIVLDSEVLAPDKSVFISIDGAITELLWCAEQHSVFVRGGPAVGKTTLAKQFCLRHPDCSVFTTMATVSQPTVEDTTAVWRNAVMTAVLAFASVRRSLAGDPSALPAVPTTVQHADVASVVAIGAAYGLAYIVIDEVHLAMSNSTAFENMIKASAPVRYILFSTTSSAASSSGASASPLNSSAITKLIWLPHLHDPDFDDLVAQLAQAGVDVDESAARTLWAIAGGHRGVFMHACEWVRKRQQAQPRKWSSKDVVNSLGDSNYTAACWTMLLECRGVKVNGPFRNGFESFLPANFPIAPENLPVWRTLAKVLADGPLTVHDVLDNGDPSSRPGLVRTMTTAGMLTAAPVPAAVPAATAMVDVPPAFGAAAAAANGAAPATAPATATASATAPLAATASAARARASLGGDAAVLAATPAAPPAITAAPEFFPYKWADETALWQIGHPLMARHYVMQYHTVAEKRHLLPFRRVELSEMRSCADVMLLALPMCDAFTVASIGAGTSSQGCAVSAAGGLLPESNYNDVIRTLLKTYVFAADVHVAAVHNAGNTEGMPDIYITSTKVQDRYVIEPVRCTAGWQTELTDIIAHLHRFCRLPNYLRKAGVRRALVVLGGDSSTLTSVFDAPITDDRVFNTLARTRTTNPLQLTLDTADNATLAQHAAALDDDQRSARRQLAKSRTALRARFSGMLKAYLYDVELIGVVFDAAHTRFTMTVHTRDATGAVTERVHSHRCDWVARHVSSSGAASEPLNRFVDFAPPPPRPPPPPPDVWVQQRGADGKAFEVTPGKNNVNALKKAIKAERPNLCANVDAADITVFAPRDPTAAAAPDASLDSDTTAGKPYLFELPPSQ